MIINIKSDGLMHKVSALQFWDRGFETHTGHGHVSSYDTMEYLLVQGSRFESDLNKL